nr:MAG TPA: hypothetical protein [Caudoviricetes sp.]
MFSWYTPYRCYFLHRPLPVLFLVLQPAPNAHRVMFQCFIRL